MLGREVHMRASTAKGGGRRAAWGLALALASGAACSGGDDSGEKTGSDGIGGGVGGGGDGGAGGAWYTTCGDPACGGYSGPVEGLPVCSSEEAGQACPSLGAECDLQDACNTRLVCATEDPKDQPGGCPQSLRSVKRDITYLDGPARRAAAGQALGLRLATWRYIDPDRGEGLKLGILLDDLGPAHPAARGDRVDLYGLSSLTVAAVQEQAAALEAERAARVAAEARLAALEARLGALEARGCP
jgi:hypothetical protein